ncbi:MAG: CHRD domain-containing protein [Nocardioides sp.]
MKSPRLVALAALLAALLGVTVAMPAQAEPATWTATLAGANEVPANDSPARGQVVLRLSADGTAIDYRLMVANIDNVTAGHIHLGGADVNGPVVAFLYGDVAPGGGAEHGVLATGTITAGDLVGPLAGMSLDELVAEIEAGNTYVNVHTNDGVDPTNTGPGDLPGGEIRGQLG